MTKSTADRVRMPLFAPPNCLCSATADSAIRFTGHPFNSTPDRNPWENGPGNGLLRLKLLRGVDEQNMSQQLPARARLPLSSTLIDIPADGTISHSISQKVHVVRTHCTKSKCESGCRTRSVRPSPNVLEARFEEISRTPEVIGDTNSSGLWSHFIACNAGSNQENKILLISGNCAARRLRTGIAAAEANFNQKSHPSSPAFVDV